MFKKQHLMDNYTQHSHIVHADTGPHQVQMIVRHTLTAIVENRLLHLQRGLIVHVCVHLSDE